MSTSTPPPAPPPSQEDAVPPAPTPPPPRRLYRRRRGRMLGGVALGVAAYLGVDVVVIRVLFVVLTFVPFGLGPLVYLALLLLMPTSRDVEYRAAVPAAVRTTGRGAGFYVGLVLIAIAGSWLLAAIGLVGPFGGRGPGVFVPLLLIGLGVALWVDADRRNSGPDLREGDPALSGPGGTESVGTAEAPTTELPTGAAATAVAAAPPVAAKPARSAPPRSAFGRIVLAVALVTGGVLWLLDQTGVQSLDPIALLAWPLLVLGAGALLGAFLGRGRSAAVVGLLLVPVLLLGLVLRGLDLPLAAGFGERHEYLDAVDDLRVPFELGAGLFVLDLARLDETPADPLQVRVAAGEIRVIVPDDAGLEGTVRAEAGELDILGRIAQGLDLERELAVPAVDDGPVIVLDLRIGAGPISVERASDAGEWWGWGREPQRHDDRRVITDDDRVITGDRRGGTDGIDRSVSTEDDR